MSWPLKIASSSDELLQNAKREVSEIVVREAFKAGGRIITASIASSEQKVLGKIRNSLRPIYLFCFYFKIESENSVPSLNFPVVKLQNCPEEFDKEPREAKFAFDLENWKNSTCAAVVIYFPRGELTNLFQVAKDEKTDHLEAFRATRFDYEVFKKAQEFGTAVTCPRELLEIAKQVN